jgi:hypothetical protein
LPELETPSRQTNANSFTGRSEENPAVASTHSTYGKSIASCHREIQAWPPLMMNIKTLIVFNLRRHRSVREAQVIRRVAAST